MFPTCISTERSKDWFSGRITARSAKKSPVREALTVRNHRLRQPSLSRSNLDVLRQNGAVGDLLERSANRKGNFVSGRQVRSYFMMILPGRFRLSPAQSWAPSIVGFQPEHEMHVGRTTAGTDRILFSLPPDLVFPAQMLPPPTDNAPDRDRLIGRNPDPPSHALGSPVSRGLDRLIHCMTPPHHNWFLLTHGCGSWRARKWTLLLLTNHRNFSCSEIPKIVIWLADAARGGYVRYVCP